MLTPLIGGHVSAAGGVYNAIANGIRIGASCIQIFGASPRQWLAKMPSQEAIEMYREALAQSNIKAVFLHAAYLVNLAAADNLAFIKSVKSLTEHLQIVEALGAQGLIFHLGTTNGSSREEALTRTIKGMKEVLKNVPGSTQLIMENSAGGGGKLGSGVDDLGFLYRGVASPRVKVCIDTAHTFESGLVSDYSAAHVKNLCDELDREVGIKNVVALHVNDSKTPTGSHHDRHENIGEGFVGLSGFKNLAAEKRLHDKAWILEVPGFDNEGPDKKNVDILKSCLSSKNRC